MKTFMGYKRGDGSVGIRNRVAVISTVSCANPVVEQICAEVPGAVRLIHQVGCGSGGRDLITHTRTLQNLCRNPNFGAVCIIGLGCELIPAESLHLASLVTKKPVEKIIIQDAGGTVKARETGVKTVRKMLDDLNKVKPEPHPFEHLKIGLECGGSDAFSGITANPAIGVVSDWITGMGGTSILTEITEMTGTNEILKRRSAVSETAEKIDALIDRTNSEARKILGAFADLSISAGNMEGGLSTVSEKSMGCITKGGTGEIMDVIEYAEIPDQKGLIIMDGPGYDPVSMTGLAASGCQLILFSTGRGSPLGFPGVPVIKISSNTVVSECLKDNIDINAGAALDKGKSIEDIGNMIIDMTVRVANGEKTSSEVHGQDGIVCLYSMDRTF